MYRRLPRIVLDCHVAPASTQMCRVAGGSRCPTHGAHGASVIADSLWIVSAEIRGASRAREHPTERRSPPHPRGTLGFDWTTWVPRSDHNALGTLSRVLRRSRFDVILLPKDSLVSDRGAQQADGSDRNPPSPSARSGAAAHRRVVGLTLNWRT